MNTTATTRPPAHLRRAPLTVLVVVLGSQMIPQATAAQGSEDVRRDFTYSLDVRQSDVSSDALGLDFDLQYELARDVQDAPQGHQFAWTLGVQGFQNFSDAMEDADFLTAGLAAQGRFYESNISSPLPARVQARVLDLLERDLAGGGPGLTPAEEQELNAFFQRAGSNSRYFSYDLHYEFEGDGELDARQHALGVGISGELPLIHELLDALPSLTRSDLAAYRTPRLRGYLGMEWVDGQQDVRVAGQPVGAGYGRATAEAAWSTLVLDDLVLRATWQAGYIVSPPAGIREADRRFNTLLQAWVVLPIGDRFGLVVKYLDGHTPPTYEQITLGQVGFNILVQ